MGVVLKLSPRAKFFAITAMVGVLGWAYGYFRDHKTVSVVGQGIFLVAVFAYYWERIRARSTKRLPPEPEDGDPND